MERFNCSCESFGYLVQVKMDIAKQHWDILLGLDADLANKVRSFLVVDWDGVVVTTDDGMGYWFGEMEFTSLEPRTANKPTLLDVPDLVSMAQGDQHILLLNRRGEIYSLGGNNHGQLGLGTVDQEIRFTPQLISIPHKFTSVRCGWWHNLALTDDGKVWAWGSNNKGQVGVPSSTEFVSSLHQISYLDHHRIVAVECGGQHSLALTDLGEVYAWGANENGQLGDGSVNLLGCFPTHQNQPARMSTPSPVRSMAAGESHTLLLTHTGEVYACGSNECRQLGFPTKTRFSSSLTQVAGLPLISQIAAHPDSSLSIAISFKKRCFVWGQLDKGKLDEVELCYQLDIDHSDVEEFYIPISTPMELPTNFSTVESPLSFYCSHRNTPHSVQVSESPPNLLSIRMSRMFNNPETSDVRFVVEQRTIHAHQNILSNSSDYFGRIFLERWLAPVDPENPTLKVITIPDHSYEVFHAFLRFIYIDRFEVHYGILPELFELATQYLVTELQQLCLSRMRITLIPATCCLYYPLAHRHKSLLADFHEDIVGFAFSRMSEVVESAAYQSMEPDLRDNLTNEVLNFSGTLFGHFQSQFLN